MYSIMTPQIYALISVAIVSCLPLLAGLLLLSKKTGDSLIFVLVSLSVGALFGDAIERIESGESLSALFESE